MLDGGSLPNDGRRIFTPAIPGERSYPVGGVASPARIQREHADPQAQAGDAQCRPEAAAQLLLEKEANGHERQNVPEQMVRARMDEVAGEKAPDLAGHHGLSSKLEPGGDRRRG